MTMFILIENELFQNHQESLKMFSNLSWEIWFAKKYFSWSMDYGFLSEILEKVCQRLEKLYLLENEVRKILNLSTLAVFWNISKISQKLEKGVTNKDFSSKSIKEH